MAQVGQLVAFLAKITIFLHRGMRHHPKTDIFKTEHTEQKRQSTNPWSRSTPSLPLYLSLCSAECPLCSFQLCVFSSASFILDSLHLAILLCGPCVKALQPRLSHMAQLMQLGRHYLNVHAPTQQILCEFVTLCVSLTQVPIFVLYCRHTCIYITVCPSTPEINE